MPGTSYLSQTDTLMWMVEADPLLRSTIMGVVLLSAGFYLFIYFVADILNALLDPRVRILE